MTTPDIPALREALRRAKADTPLDAEGFIVFGADGEVVAECSDSQRDARLIALAVNALPGLLDRLEKLERVEEAVVEYLEPSHPMKRRQGIAPLLAALADLDGGEGS